MKKELEYFAGTSVYGQLRSVIVFYDSLRQDILPFEAEFCISCPAECGRCCEHFLPDVTHLEALYLAFFMIEVQKRDISFLSDWNGRLSCPLFDSSSKRCTAYEARPLVCRLFNSAASLTKSGLSFRSCRMTTEPEKSHGISSDDLERSKVRVPVMSRYGEMLEAMQEDGKTELLDKAVPDAAMKLMLIKNIISMEDSGRAG